MASSVACRALVLVVVAAAACAEAGGKPSGGELTEAGARAIAQPDSGSSLALLTRMCAFEGGGDAPGAAPWSGIYRDLFGQPADTPGSCTFARTCHNGPDAPGTTASGFDCSSEEACCRSLVTARLVDVDDPPRSRVVAALRGASGVAKMPLRPPDYRYSEADIARIEAWIRTGSGDGGAPDEGDAGADAAADPDAGDASGG